MNFSDWRIRLKLLEAIKRLGEKQPLKEIAFDVGYETTSAFICMFKKRIWTTPSHFLDQRIYLIIEKTYSAKNKKSLNLH